VSLAVRMRYSSWRVALQEAQLGNRVRASRGSDEGGRRLVLVVWCGFGCSGCGPAWLVTEAWFLGTVATDCLSACLSVCLS
jgi:hypothetical protein